MGTRIFIVITVLSLSSSVYSTDVSRVLNWRYLDIEEDYKLQIEDSLKRLLVNDALSDADRSLILVDLAYLNYLRGNTGFSEALTYLEEAIGLELQDGEAKSSLYFVLGLISFDRDSADQSLRFYRKSLSHLQFSDERSDQIADIHGRIGDVYYHKFYNLDSAIFYYKKERSLLNSNQVKRLSLNIKNRSLYYREKGQLTKSLQLVQSTLPQLESKQLSYQLADCYSALGNVYFQMADFDKSIDSYNRGITSINSRYSNHSILWRLFISKSLAFANQSKFDSAKLYAEKALLIGELSDLKSKIGSTLSSIAVIDREMGSYKEALNNFKKSILNTAPYKKSILFYTYLDISLTYELLFDTTNNPQYLDSALLISDKSREIVSKLDGGDGSEVTISFETFEPYQIEASLFLKRFHYSADSIWLSRSITSALQSERIFWKGYKDIVSNQTRLIYREHFNKTYSLLAEAFYHKYRITKQIQSLEGLFNSLRRYKSAVLLENYSLLSQTDSLNAKEIFEPLFREENISDDREFLSISYQDNLLDQVRKDMSSKDLILDFYLFDDELYRIEIERDKINADLIDFTIADQQLLDSLNQLLSNPSVKHNNEHFNAFVVLSSHFYQKLLPVFDGNESRDILICPDGPLNFLPFEALIKTGDTKGQISYRDLEYLIRDHSVSYSPSVEIYQLTKNTRHADFDALLVGNTFENEDNQIANVSSELLQIEKIMGDRSELLTTPSKAKLSNMVAGFSVLHFATHSYSGANGNAILLGTDSLETMDIYGLNLNADLVFLSACESGFGSSQTGEGVFSIARDFLTSGARSVLATFWPYTDYVAPKISEDFYFYYIIEGVSKSESLRRAKLNYLSNADELSSHPFFWSSLILIGNKQMSHANQYLFHWLYLLLVVLFIPVIIYLSKLLPRVRMFM